MTSNNTGTSAVKTHNLGFPRIGPQRELKKSLEAYWSGKASEQALRETAFNIRQTNWKSQKNAKLDFIPSNDFSFYDQMLDMAVMVGATPARYQKIKNDLTRYFAIARGLQDQATETDVPAMEMTKWFDTNYHYIVPELEIGQKFELNLNKILGEVLEARSLGIETKPVVIGPVSFLLLSKLATDQFPLVSTLDLLPSLLPIYEKLFEALSKNGVEWVQLDEPCLVLELDAQAGAAYTQFFNQFKGWKRPKVMLTTYFGSLKQNLEILCRAGAEAIHVDLVRSDEFDTVLKAVPANTILSLGLVDGRNIWRTDIDQAHKKVQKAVAQLGAERVWVGPSCSMLHVPVDLSFETKLDDEFKSWLSYGIQKLDEVRLLGDIATEKSPTDERVLEARAAIQSRRTSDRINNFDVKRRVESIEPSMFSRAANYTERSKLQQSRFQLPAFPTTTIGSFPQTEAIRKARSEWRSKKMSEESYEEFLKKEFQHCVQKQEEIGLDVLVHGEFERTDMVEYFGEKLTGFAFTANGWVQSYGSRCVKPPIIYGNVNRPYAMTVRWSAYAQSLTKKPMKGMLTGPVTILQWSFVRDDQPRSRTCLEIALALRDEVRDLEKAGISMIQVDEPAIREGLPLRREEWKTYLNWAVDAFKVATSGVASETQIHTHMCYSEFGDILDSVAAMDADVLSIETSRSRMELLGDFSTFQYPNAVGPGVYDIHSPRVPTEVEMTDLLTQARKVVSPEKLWVNPDCGLKTRGWPEVQLALENMVKAAQAVRR